MPEYIYASAAQRLRDALEQRADSKAARIRWMLELPDLSRQRRSPVRYLVDRVRQADCLARADTVIFPEIVSTRRNFDLLNTAADHPSRQRSDTYYVDNAHVLRTQTTSMWTWYLQDECVLRRLNANGRITGLAYGKVYRNDDIDRSHYPVFHQIDAICIAKRSMTVYTIDDLDAILRQIAELVFGGGAELRISEDSFPFTEPSRQLEVKWSNDWLEVVGSGLVHTSVLSNLGLDPAEYNGWAFGFGLDRLAMRKMEIPDIRILWSTDERVTSQFESPESKFVAVSKYPATYRDVTFVVDDQVKLNDFYDIVRACASLDGEELIEAVEHIDRYENVSRFGEGRVSHSFRIAYRSFLRTLTNSEINDVQAKIRKRIESELGGILR